MKVSDISKREINDILTDGMHRGEFYYYGRMDDTAFLNRLTNINLAELPSDDSRFENMLGDIWQHTVNNDDWDIDWVFHDRRLNVLYNEELFIEFIEQIFHPIVRDEKSDWKEYFNRINSVLEFDKLHLLATEEISGRSIYTIEPIKK